MKLSLGAGFLLAVGASVFASLANAEVYECDGKWTNKPCSGEVTKSIEELGAQAPANPSTKLLREKTSILHELRMKNLRAKADYDIRYDIAGVESFCLKQASSVEDCREKVKKLSDEFDQKTTSAGALAEQKKAVALQEEANRLQEERNRIEEAKPNITVIENERYRPIIVVPRGNSHSVHGSSGVSVSVSGSSGSGSISGTLSGSTTTSNGSVAPIIVVPPPAPRPNSPHNSPHSSGVTVYDNGGQANKLNGVKPGPFAR